MYYNDGYIKFSGKNRKGALARAIVFFSDNLTDSYDLNDFLKNCRYCAKSQAVYFYPIEFKGKSKEHGEERDSCRHRWGFGKLLQWFRKTPG